jgi:riboflavin kinase/FMN adenylyltransferase
MPANAGAARKPLTPHLLDHVPAALTGAVYAIGNFDGVHLGHAVLFETAMAAARPRGLPAVVLTFEPHPRSVFHPEAPVFRLAPLDAKARLFAAFGMDGLIVIPFDRSFAGRKADAFVESDLVGRLAAKAVVVGYDFHFGKGRAGSPEYLSEAGRRLGFDVNVISPVANDAGIAISSSRIRAHLEAGDVVSASRLLGYRWFVTGEVVAGDQRGRALGMPTANLRLAADCRLRHGIYAVHFRRDDGSVHHGVASYGRRPTFDNGPPILEVHLLDFAGDLYGEHVIVTFRDWIRAEARFETVDALVAEMRRDLEAARLVLADTAAGSPVDRALDAVA